MIKKHGKELTIWIIISVGVVLLLLGMVYLFEKNNIHVPGSREMWIGLIGAVLGGMFTMIGVLVTVYKQEEQNQEDKRLEYMPILSFEIVDVNQIKENNEYVIYDEPIFDGSLACLDGELCTSAFPDEEGKSYKVIQIAVLNNACVFDFTIDGCLIEGKEIKKGAAFSPAKRRIVAEETYRLFFCNMDYSETNEICLIRFSYKDIFGNKYYQDLPIQYIEVGSSGEVKQIIDIRDIKAPIFYKDKMKCLEETAKEYCDFKEFC